MALLGTDLWEYILGMPKDFRTTLGKLRGKPTTQKGRATFYLHMPRVREFKKLCAQASVSASQVIDSWIEDALEEAKAKK